MKGKIKYLILPVLILALAVGGYAVTRPVNSLTMDVNPSIEIVTNRLDRVVEINPLNEDAKELLKDFNPKDKNLERTVNDLVDLMILTGHIRGGDDNFVMITVTDKLVDSKVVNKINEAIAAMLQNKQIEATVLNQTITKSDKGKKQTGVQLAAQKIQEIDGGLTAEQLGSMTVKELIYYSRDNNISIEDIFRVAAGNIDTGRGKEFERDDDYKDKSTVDKSTVDKASTDVSKKQHNTSKGRISAEEAKDIAFGLTGGGRITEFELDDDEYEIEIKYKGKEYEVEIDAYTGKILEFEVDDD
ncbi:MAG: hypothetical protein GX339_03630 [Tissierellia bacterium]|nr:hypothetical protein [Tissierellia bacterium]